MSDLSKRLREMAEWTTIAQEESDDLLAAADAIEAGEPQPWPPPADCCDLIVYRPDAGWFQAVAMFDEDGEKCWWSAGGVDDLTGQEPTHYVRSIPAPPEVTR